MTYGVTVKFFDQLGSDIERRWRALDYNERAFADLAQEALSNARPADHIGYDEIIEEFAFGTDLPAQLHDLSFGQPPIATFRGPGFYIEALCWLDGTTTIHDHIFDGAFYVLEGASIHTRYRFEEEHRFNSALYTGRVTFQSAELLQKGDLRRIDAGRGFIHGLFHLARPSVSIVVRTNGSREHLPQLNYHPPYVADDNFVPEIISTRNQRFVALYRALVARDRAAQSKFVRRLGESGDALLLWTLLRRAPADSDGTEVSAHLQEILRDRYGLPGERLVASAEHARRLEDLRLRRASILNPDHRVFLALLLNVPDQARMLNLVETYGGADSKETLRRWIRELTVVPRPGAAQLLEVTLDCEDGSPGMQVPELLHETIALMMEGSRGETLLARLREKPRWLIPSRRLLRILTYLKRA